MPTERGKVSIVTPTYNHASFIGACIESVLAQSYQNWEMLIVDDGSADGTGETVATYRDQRIVYLRQEHKGLAALGERYNLALGQATGDFIAILEGDDFWPPNRLERQLPEFDDSDVVLASGLFAATDEHGRRLDIMPLLLPPPHALLNDPIGSSSIAMMAASYLTFAFPVSTMVRKEALLRIGGFQQTDYLPLVDYPTFMNLGLLGRWRFDCEVLGYWRRHSESVTSTRFLAILDGAQRYASEFLQAHRRELPLRDNDLQNIRNEWRLMQMDRMILTGMRLLEEGSYREARRYFDRLSRFPVTKTWRSAARLMRALSSGHLNPGLVRRLILSRIPCKVPRGPEGERFLLPYAPVDAFEPYSFD